MSYRMEDRPSVPYTHRQSSPWYGYTWWSLLVPQKAYGIAGQNTPAYEWTLVSIIGINWLTAVPSHGLSGGTRSSDTYLGWSHHVRPKDIETNMDITPACATLQNISQRTGRWAAAISGRRRIIHKSFAIPLAEGSWMPYCLSLQTSEHFSGAQPRSHRIPVCGALPSILSPSVLRSTNIQMISDGVG
jgi:hypothetical protein